jgi:hypothetical protein
MTYSVEDLKYLMARPRDPDNRPDEAWIKASWERIKAEERALKPDAEPDKSRLRDIARTLPAMVRAEKLQRRKVTDKYNPLPLYLHLAWPLRLHFVGQMRCLSASVGDQA